MTAEDILKKYLDRLPFKTRHIYSYDITVEMLKEFAIYCCEKQKEICAENAEVSYGYSCIIDKYTIINSPLPEELL